MSFWYKLYNEFLDASDLGALFRVRYIKWAIARYYDIFDLKFYENENLKFNFCGFRENVQDYIAKSHFVVIPSRYESFSMVAIESLSCQTPIIAPYIGGLKEIIDSETIGLFFKAENIEDLYNKIIYGINNYTLFDKKKAKERSLYFKIERQGQEYLKIYKELLK